MSLLWTFWPEWWHNRECLSAFHACAFAPPLRFVQTRETRRRLANSLHLHAWERTKKEGQNNKKKSCFLICTVPKSFTLKILSQGMKLGRANASSKGTGLHAQWVCKMNLIKNEGNYAPQKWITKKKGFFADLKNMGSLLPLAKTASFRFCKWLFTRRPKKKT